MRKVKWLALLLTTSILMLNTWACQKKSPTKPLNYNYSGQASLRFPGEFEKQQAIWLMWPSSIYDSNDRPVSPVMVQIIKGLAPFTTVNIMAASNDEISSIDKALSASGVNSKSVKYYVISHASIWARDVGPIFVKGPGNQLRVVNFGFNNYSRGGSPDYVENEALVDVRTANLLGLPIINSPLISEGGAIESNGQGTLMTTESVVLRRNPNLSKQQIAAEYGKVLGIKKMIWLKKGLAEDDQITTGHINEIARFADPHTVLLAQILESDRYASPTAQESYRRLEENYRILQGATDQDGRPLKIIRLPMPPTLYAEANTTGKIPVRTYLNYALTDGAVLVQTYWHPGRAEILKTTEAQVLKQFAKIFPGRKVIGVDSENINQWGGGIHCVTQHMPAVK
ncbi:MAG: agmatine deiminase family protein [Methylocystaceae bacterium]